MEITEILREGNSLLNMVQGTDVIDDKLSVSRRWETIDKIKFILKISRIVTEDSYCEYFNLISDENGKVRAGLNKILGKAIVNALKIDLVDIMDYEKTHHFHPILNLFISLGKECNVFNDRIWDFWKLQGNRAAQTVSELNSFVRKFQGISSTKEFKKVVRNFERRSRENYAQLVKYIDSIFFVRARLLVLRLDLWYKESYIKNHKENYEEVYRRIKNDWKSLHRHMTRDVFAHSLIGFVWKLEYGANRSYHLHTLILLDGSKHQKDIVVTKMLGDFWEKKITGGDGYYFNCNAQKYHTRAVGEIHRSNLTIRNALINTVCGYLTKPDLILPLRTPDGGRSFGKGKMPLIK